MEGSATDAAAGGQAHDHRHRNEGAIVVLGTDIHNLVETIRHKICELHFRHGTHAGNCRAGGCPNDGGFSKHCVDNALLSEFLDKPLRDFECAAVCSDVFTKH